MHTLGFITENLFFSLLQVCEVYALHRETFYLAQDFFDRFMLTQKNINKSMLQLIGITSLFIASKLEVRHKEEDVTFKVTEGGGNVFISSVWIFWTWWHTHSTAGQKGKFFFFSFSCACINLLELSLCPPFPLQQGGRPHKVKRYANVLGAVLLCFVFRKIQSSWQTISGMGVGLEQNHGCVSSPYSRLISL